MKYLRLAFFIITLPVFFIFVDYVLPHKEVLRVTDSYSRITEIGMNRLFYAQEDIVAGANGVPDNKRDVRFIATITPSGKVKVFRNEDTGWVYPPYFKYDSATLQGQFSSLVSGEENTKWVMVTSYGWRIPWMSIFPNAVGVSRVSGPDVSTVSIPALLVLFLMFVLVLFLNRAYVRFINRSVDPMIADFDARADAFRADVSEAADRKTKGFRDWLGTWRGVARK